MYRLITVLASQKRGPTTTSMVEAPRHLQESGP